MLIRMSNSLIISIISYFSLIVIKYFRRKHNKNNINFFEKIKIISPHKLTKTNINNKEYLFFTGKIKKVDNTNLVMYMNSESTFYLSNLKNNSQILFFNNPYSYNFDYYNLRLGSLEKIYKDDRIFSNLFSLLFLPFLFYKNEKSFSNYYLIYDDMVTIYGKLNKNNDLNTYYITPEIISQGNKMNLIHNYMKYSKRYEKAENLFSFTCITGIFTFLFNFVLQNFNCYQGDMTNQTLRIVSKITKQPENCKKCNKFYKNVIFLDCNHFLFCINCYIELNKQCPLCDYFTNDNIRILQDD